LNPGPWGEKQEIIMLMWVPISCKLWQRPLIGLNWTLETLAFPGFKKVDSQKVQLWWLVVNSLGKGASFEAVIALEESIDN